MWLSSNEPPGINRSLNPSIETGDRDRPQERESKKEEEERDGERQKKKRWQIFPITKYEELFVSVESKPRINLFDSEANLILLVSRKDEV